MDSLFLIVPLLFFIIFAAVTFIIIFTIVKVIKNAITNNSSSVNSVNAFVVTKRIAVNNGVNGSYSRHYVTFEVENKGRLELEMSGDGYGLLVENDKGILTYKGTQYISFQRNGNTNNNTAQNNFEKRCPYCMSIVKSNAVRCNNCGAGF